MHYLERVGLDYVKRRVVEDAESRRALFERLLYALDGLPDPWEARIAGKQRNEYIPITLVEA